MKSSRWSLWITMLVLLFLHLPTGALVARSFNAARFSPEWQGFTWKWYEKLWERDDLVLALANSFKVALASAIISMIIGTSAALAMHQCRGRLRKLHGTMIHAPLVLPDLLIGMAMLLFFVSAGLSLSLITVTVAHVTICMSYVTLAVHARLRNLDPSLLDAAVDLGASRAQAIGKVLLPMVRPAVLAGGLMAFTVSIDDFVIAFFVKGPGAETLPTLVYSMIRKSRELPVINALSSLVLVFTALMVFAFQRLLRSSAS